MNKKEKIERVTFKGCTYPVLGFNELKGEDWRRIVLNLERGIELPGEMERVIRGCLAIWVPSATRDMRKWTFTEILNFVASVWHLVNLNEGVEIMRRYEVAALEVTKILQERYAATE